MTPSTELLVALSTVLLDAVLARWESVVDCQWRQQCLSATVTENLCVDDPAPSR